MSEARPDPTWWRLALSGVRATDHQRHKAEPVGFDFVHVAVDDFSRVVYAEVLPDERVATCAAFLHRAVQWFHDQHDVTVRRVLTDNAMSYRRRNAWAAVCSALQVERRFIKPVLPLEQRQGRAVYPDAADRLGLRPTLDQQRPAHRSL